MGGQHDVNIIKGHSKTYVSAVPGVIIRKLCTTGGWKNPVIFIDEIDKISDRNGGMEGALCELLDPDHNRKFEDYYMGFPWDISNCIFVVAMNDHNKVGRIISDRLQILKVKPYSHIEKINMSLSHLIPRVIINIGMKSEYIEFTSDAMNTMLTSSNIQESGVRQLIRNIETVVRRLNRMHNMVTGFYKDGRDKKLIVTSDVIKEVFWEPNNGTDHHKHMFT